MRMTTYHFGGDFPSPALYIERMSASDPKQQTLLTKPGETRDRKFLCARAGKGVHACGCRGGLLANMFCTDRASRLECCRSSHS